MVVDKGLLNGSIELLTVSIHLGGFGVRVPVGDLLILLAFSEMALEFATIVREAVGVFEDRVVFAD